MKVFPLRNRWHVSVLVKIGVLGTVVSVLAAAALGVFALEATSERIDETYASKASEVTELISAQISRHPDDYKETDRLLADLVRTQPSIARIRVVRETEPGVAGLWASSYATDVALDLPDQLLEVAAGDISQGEVSLSGSTLFLTVEGVDLPNDIRAITVYASPEQRDTALALARNALGQAAGVVIVAQLIVLVVALYFVVVRRVRRLERVAAAVAAGDLSVRAADQSGSRRLIATGDELDEVTREFDHMIRSLQERDRRQGGVVSLGRKALSGLELQPLLDEAIHEVAAQLDADVAILFEGRERSRFIVRAAEGFGDRHEDAALIGVDSHPSKALIANGAVELLPSDATGLLARLGVVDGVGVPIAGPDDVPWGVLATYSRTPRAFDPESCAFLEAVANVIASAIGQRIILERERESERRFRMVVENATELIALVDRAGTIVYASPAFLPLLEVEPKDLIDERLVTLAHPSDVGRLGRALVDMASGGISEEHDLRLRKGSGGYLTVNGTIASIIDEGSVEILLFIAHDVTEEVRAQEERRQLLSSLLSAQEEERTRIAGEIHDDPIQAMTAVGFRVEALRRLTSDPKADEVLTRVAASVAAAVDRLRHLMFELRPPSLDQVGIAAALKEYVRKEATDDGFSFSLVSELDDEPDPDTRAIVYRLAQEALINVRKHARADRVEITLESLDGGVRTRVRDDGVGFDMNRGVEVGHVGILTMRERAHLAGGWFKIDSSPGAGTSIEFWIPAVP